RCVDHLVAREMWHLSANQVLRAYESGIWPAWRKRLAEDKKKAASEQHARALIRLGATGIEKTPVAVFYPDAAAGYLRTVWNRSKDKSAIVPRLRAFDWAPWSPSERKRVFGSVHSAYKVWSAALARRARKKGAKVDPKLLRQIPLIGKALDQAITLRSPKLDKAPNPLCRAVAAAAIASRGGRDTKAYVAAAREAYKHVAEYDVRKIPCGRQVMTFLLDTEHRRAKRSIDFLCEVLGDQLARYGSGSSNTRVDEVIDLVMTNRYDRLIRSRNREVMKKINPVFAKAMSAQLRKGRLPPKIFNWFRTTRSGQYWKEHDWGRDVMATIIAKRMLHKTPYRPLVGVRSATASYMLLIRREFPKLQSKYPVGTYFD
ncbi:hypothetical protein LCGC14_2964680, partial [marine sediment metagenome]